MSLLSPRLQLRVAQKQILTPGLVQMVTVLQLNRLELKEMIAQEMALNPVLEESVDGIEELTQEEVQQILESERVSDPSDRPILETMNEVNGASDVEPPEAPATVAEEAAASASPPDAEVKTDSDPFDEID